MTGCRGLLVPHILATTATRVGCRSAKIGSRTFTSRFRRPSTKPISSSGDAAISRAYYSSFSDSKDNRQAGDSFSANASSSHSSSSDKSMASVTTHAHGKPEVRDITMDANSPKEKIRLQGVEQTLLPMVLFKARDNLSANPILGDPYAKQLLDRCDVDMEDSHFKATTDERYVTWIANRSKQLDQWCQDYLDSHNEPVTVLHLGCGLDCRYFRVQRRPDSQVRWLDIDQLMVVDLRSRLIPGPVDGDYALRTLDVTKEGWYRDVPADRPILIIAEGLMPYLEPSQGQKLIRELVEYFAGAHVEGEPKNQIIFDTLGSLSIRLTGYIKALRSSKATFKWGVDEPEQILEIDSRLRLKDRVLWRSFMDSHPPFFGKYGTTMASVMPSFEKNIQFWRFKF